MSRVIVDICDRCGATRKSANHWFRVEPSGDNLTIFEHKTEEPLTETMILACGEKCVQHLVSAYLSGKDLPRANQQAPTESVEQPPGDEFRTRDVIQRGEIRGTFGVASDVPHLAV
jgi:hypothetical protein